MSAKSKFEFHMTGALGTFCVASVLWWFVPTVAYWVWLVFGTFYVLLIAVEWWINRDPERVAHARRRQLNG